MTIAPAVVIDGTTEVEVAWRVLAAPPRGGKRLFGILCLRVRGPARVRALSADIVAEAWNGELRLRVGDGPPLYTHVLDVAAWTDRDPCPRARIDSLWRDEARRDADAAAFLSLLRPVIQGAASRRVVHPRDAQALLALAAAACVTPLSRPD